MTLNDWKTLEITKEILSKIKERQDAAKELLAISAGVDPLEDRWKCGAIAAYQDILDIEQDTEETHD